MLQQKPLKCMTGYLDWNMPTLFHDTLWAGSKIATITSWCQKLSIVFTREVVPPQLADYGVKCRKDNQILGHSYIENWDLDQLIV